MTDPQIASADAIIAPGIDTLVALRPRALQHINAGRGRYAYIFRGLKAQAALLLRRQAAEAKAKRLELASGDELRDLAASEFLTYAPDQATKAVGVMYLNRGAGLPGGVFRKGFKFQRIADPARPLPLKAATYEAVLDVPYAYGSGPLAVPVRATQPGTHANAPICDGFTTGTVNFADTPPDPTFQILDYRAGGGSDGEGDPELVAQALSFVDGQYAPNRASILAGALRGTGVRHAAQLDVTQYLPNTPGAVLTPCAFTNLVIADESWSSSDEWCQQVAQQISDDFLGFGCNVAVNGVVNFRIAVTASVMLRDARYLSDTNKIAKAIQAALRDYFDLRPDWYTWKLAQVRAVITHAHRKILTCTTAQVLGVRLGLPLADPAPFLPTSTAGNFMTHYALADNAVTTTFLPPT
jgi:hypothetical protein